MNMRPSRVLSKLRNGGASNCIRLNLDGGRIVEIAAMHGFDCVWIDMEHTPADWSLLEKQIWAAKMHDVDVLVRVPRGSYSDYIRPLELDAAGIMVPHIMSAADAESVVRMTRFHPLGRRAVDGGNADGAFCNLELTDYMRQANTNRFVIVQIEDPEPLDELDEIAALPGIDMLFFGPADFSQAIGAPAEWDHPAIADAYRRVAEACRRHDKVAGTVAGAYNARQLLDLGYRFINVGVDIFGLNQYFQKLNSEFLECCKDGLHTGDAALRKVVGNGQAAYGQGMRNGRTATANREA